MTSFCLTGKSVAKTTSDATTIFCPATHGLTAAQVDLTFLIPRLNHNGVVRDSQRWGEWAALLACDPFGTEALLFDALRAKGYLGVTNWPSSILLQGQAQQAMSTIPASADYEYAYLARAASAGFKTMAFFRSLSQAQLALARGIDCLIMHPGILEPNDAEACEYLQQQLQKRIKTIRAEAPDATILAYTSDWHEHFIALNELPVDGLVRLEDSDEH